MTDDRDTWIRNIKAVEREYLAVRFSVDRALGQVQLDPSLLTGDLRVREIKGAAGLLKVTYTLRLFAEFEAALRSFHKSMTGRTSPAMMRDLLMSVASRRLISPEYLEHADLVRQYRNLLVHDRAKAELFERKQTVKAKVEFAAARNGLCVFLSFLPRSW